MDDDEFGRQLRSARSGDERAYAAIWRQHFPRVLRYLTVIAGRDAAEDIAAETWLDVARGLDKFSGDEDGFRAWLFTIARRRAVDARRAASRRPVVVGLDDRADPATAALGPADLVENASATGEALALIAGLNPDQAEIVALRVIAGLDVSEVAEITGKNAGAVRVAAHRGLRELARRLDALEDERDIR
jgi:RNA polymerase sigma-70 factor (ECF subfamily)